MEYSHVWGSASYVDHLYYYVYYVQPGDTKRLFLSSIIHALSTLLPVIIPVLHRLPSSPPSTLHIQSYIIPFFLTTAYYNQHLNRRRPTCVSQVDSKTHLISPQSKLPEVMAQLDSKITHMMKAVNAALVKDERGPGGAGGGAASLGGSSEGGVEGAGISDSSSAHVEMVPKAMYNAWDPGEMNITSSPAFVTCAGK